MRFCAGKRVTLIRKVLVEHCGKGPLERPFYYFSVRDTREYIQDFVRLNCDGGGQGMCWNRAEQFQRVTVTPPLAKALDQSDIAVKNHPISPRIYLISRRLKELMDPQRFSGVSFTPCLEAGSDYTPEEKAFDSHSDRLEKEARYFQLSITSRTPGKPSIGNLLASSSCPRCGAASIIEGDQELQFKPADLAQQDFQWFRDVASNDMGDQRLVGQIAIISSRALSFFIENGIKGLKPYATDPPVKYAAVQICVSVMPSTT